MCLIMKFNRKLTKWAAADELLGYEISVRWHLLVLVLALHIDFGSTTGAPIVWLGGSGVCWTSPCVPSGICDGCAAVCIAYETWRVKGWWVGTCHNFTKIAVASLHLLETGGILLWKTVCTLCIKECSMLCISVVIRNRIEWVGCAEIVAHMTIFVRLRIARIKITPFNEVQSI